MVRQQQGDFIIIFQAVIDADSQLRSMISNCLLRSAYSVKLRPFDIQFDEINFFDFLTCYKVNSPC